MPETTLERVQRVFLKVAKGNHLNIEVSPNIDVEDFFNIYQCIEFTLGLKVEFKGEVPGDELSEDWIEQCVTLQEIADFIDRERAKLVPQGG